MKPAAPGPGPAHSAREPASESVKEAWLAQGIPAGHAIVFAPPKKTIGLFPLPKAGGLPQPGLRPAAQLQRGQMVRFFEVVNAGVGEGAPTWARVSVNGEVGLVANRALITEDRLTRSPRGDWAVFSAISGCPGEDAPCAADIWLMRIGGEARTPAAQRISAEGEQLDAVSWSPDGERVAISQSPLGGAAGPYVKVIALETLALLALPKEKHLVAAAFGPDGALYLRGGAATMDDALHVLEPAGELRLLHREPGTHFGVSPDHQQWEAPPAPHPPTFLPGGGIEAHFYREKTEVTVRLRPDGKVISREVRPSR